MTIRVIVWNVSKKKNDCSESRSKSMKPLKRSEGTNAQHTNRSHQLTRQTVTEGQSNQNRHRTQTADHQYDAAALHSLQRTAFPQP